LIDNKLYNKLSSILKSDYYGATLITGEYESQDIVALIEDILQSKKAFGKKLTRKISNKNILQSLSQICINENLNFVSRLITLSIFILVLIFTVLVITFISIGSTSIIPISLFIFITYLINRKYHVFNLAQLFRLSKQYKKLKETVFGDSYSQVNRSRELEIEKSLISIFDLSEGLPLKINRSIFIINIDFDGSQKVLSNLKYFVTTCKTKFVFVGKRGIYDRYLADISDRNFFIGSIFNEVFYLKDEQKSKTSEDEYLSFPSIEDDIKQIISSIEGIDKSIITPHSDLGSFRSDEIIEKIKLYLDKKFNVQTEYELKAKNYGEIIEHYIEKYPYTIKEKVSSRYLSIIEKDGNFIVRLLLDDGTCCYPDSTQKLPCDIYLSTFSKWSNILKELEEIINSKRTKESDLQKFFETYPELLTGDDYSFIVPQAIIKYEQKNVNWAADFILCPKDQYEYAKMIELKIPNMNILNRPKSGHVTFSAKVWHSIQQMRDYQDAFDEVKVRENFHNKYGFDVFKPDMQLIVGRKWDIKLKNEVRRLEAGSPVNIINWDTFLARLKRNYT
jgi:hypothetical protein